jgi:hypothetical protein
VDGWQVDDVEAHGGDGIQPLRRRAKAAGHDLAGGLVDVRALGAREELVPGAEQRALAVGEERVGTLGADQVAQGMPVEHLVDGEGDGGGVARALGSPGVPHRLARVREHPTAGGAFGQGRGCSLEDQRALLEHQLHVDAGRDLDLRVVPPGRDRVAPRLDRERPRTSRVRCHLGRPEVGLLSLPVHPHGGTALPVRAGQHHIGVQLVVALPEHQRGHPERLAHGGLGGVPAAFDDGGHVRHGDSSDHGPNIPFPRGRETRRITAGDRFIGSFKSIWVKVLR